jgi:hypothetical protein
MNERDIRSAFGQSVGRLYAKQATADDRNAATAGRNLVHHRYVHQIAEGHDPGQVDARQGQPHGI